MITLATIPAILALTNLAKRLGLTGTVSVAVAVVLGVAITLAEHAWSASEWWQAAAQGLLLGLSAAGLYDVATTITPRQQPPA